MVEFSKVQCTARYDYVDWVPIKLYLGAIFLFLPRQILMLGIITWARFHFPVTFKLFGKGKYQDEQSKFYLYLDSLIRVFTQRFLRYSVGITDYKQISHKVSEYFADYISYEEKQENVQAPIYVCNHQAACDIFVLQDIFPYVSFLAKIGITKIPGIGKICTIMQSLYIIRGNQDSAKIVSEEIKKRVDDIQAGKNFPSLQIFPEGSTNVGNRLMGFKEGAFVNNCPIKVLFLEYKYNGVNPCQTLYNELEFLIFRLCTFNMTLHLHEFTNFDVNYTMQKHNLKEGDERIPELIIKDITYMMEYALNVKYTGDSFRDRVQLETNFGVDMQYEERKMKLDAQKKNGLNAGEKKNGLNTEEKKNGLNATKK